MQQAISTTSEKKSGYLPSLDGWRAIAVAGILLTHDTAWTATSSPEIKPRWQDLGGNGVALFFAISGLLITTRILEDDRLRGYFDIRGFYIRRVFRIQPAAFAYLSVLALLMLLHVLHNTWQYWLGATFLYENFLWKGSASVAPGFFVGHFWSLAVEEHFYVLLSLVFLVTRRHRFLLLAALYVAFYTAQRIAESRGLIDEPSLRRTYWQLQFLLFPAAVAVLLQLPKVKAWAVRFMQPWAVFAGTAVLLLIHHWHKMPADRTPWHAPFDFLASEMGFLTRYYFALWIVATMLHPTAWSTRVLEWRPLRWIGKISYSLYLWHLLFFFKVASGTHVTQPFLVALSGRPAKYIAAITAAALSYYLLELPLMRLGHRLAPSIRPGRPELVEASSPVQA